MATAVQPKADQPRVSTESLKRGEKSPNLQYRVQAIKEPRNIATISYGRGKRS